MPASWLLVVLSQLSLCLSVLTVSFLCAPLPGKGSLGDVVFATSGVIVQVKE